MKTTSCYTIPIAANDEKMRLNSWKINTDADFKKVSFKEWNMDVSCQKPDIMFQRVSYKNINVFFLHGFLDFIMEGGAENLPSPID